MGNMLLIKQARVLFIKDRSKNSVYSHIFSLFKLTGINEIFKTRTDDGNYSTFQRCNTLSLIITTIIFTGISITNVSVLLLKQDNLLEKIAQGTLFLVAILFRVHLSKNFNELLILADTMNKNLFPSLPKRTMDISWVNIWCFVVNVPLILISYNYIIHNGEKHFLLGYSIINDIYRHLFAFLYSVCFCTFCYVPLNIFAIYYTALCYELKKVIEGYKNIIKEIPRLNYTELSDLYIKIKFNAKTFDTKLGFLSLNLFLFNALLMHLGIGAVLYPKPNANFLTKTLMLVFCLITLANFLIQVSCASLVNDASLSVRDEAKAIRQENPQLVSAYLRFLLICQDEISLTLWGIVSMKRIFIVGTIGTILTYSILFDSFRK